MPAESAKQAPKLSTRCGFLKQTPISAIFQLGEFSESHFHRKQVASILTPADCFKRVAMAMPSMKKMESTEGLSSVWVSDESHFYLNGVVNKANCVL